MGLEIQGVSRRVVRAYKNIECEYTTHYFSKSSFWLVVIILSENLMFIQILIISLDIAIIMIVIKQRDLHYYFVFN